MNTNVGDDPCRMTYKYTQYIDCTATRIINGIQFHLGPVALILDSEVEWIKFLVYFFRVNHKILQSV